MNLYGAIIMGRMAKWLFKTRVVFLNSDVYGTHTHTHTRLTVCPLQYSRLRDEFDVSLATCSAPDHALSLTGLMMLFYTRTKDNKRLVNTMLIRLILRYETHQSIVSTVNFRGFRGFQPSLENARSIY